MNFDFLFILISILIITILIVVHEFGHYLAAKYYGFQTPIFGIGLPFGPYVDLFKKWGTQFRFHFLLIGGFVSIPELGDESDPELLKQLKTKKPLKKFPVFQRAVVASGGIVFNILFAFLLCIVMSATVGIPRVVADASIAGFVKENPIAKNAGLLQGDKIIEVNSLKIENGKELQAAIKELKGKEAVIKIERFPKLKDADPKEAAKEGANGHKFDLNAEPEVKIIRLTTSDQGSIGVMLGYKQEYENLGLNPVAWVWESFKFTAETFISMILSVIGLLQGLVMKIVGILVPGVTESEAHLDQVKGIVGIVQIISNDIKENWIMVYQFAILLSLNLAVINLLPIPALDGGHLLFMAYEAIAGEKASEKFQEISIQFGFLFLLAIIAITTINDVKNWIFS